MMIAPGRKPGALGAKNLYTMIFAVRDRNAPIMQRAHRVRRCELTRAISRRAPCADAPVAVKPVDNTCAVTIGHENIAIAGEGNVSRVVKWRARLVALTQGADTAPCRIKHHHFMRISVNHPNGAVRPATQHMPIDDLGAPSRFTLALGI